MANVRVYHREQITGSRLAARLRQVQARRYRLRSTHGNEVYQSPHGWIEVVPSGSGYLLKYYEGCPC